MIEIQQHEKRCETCFFSTEFRQRRHMICWCPPFEKRLIPKDVYDWIKIYGCASHSDVAMHSDVVITDENIMDGKHRGE